MFSRDWPVENLKEFQVAGWLQAPQTGAWARRL